MKVTVKVHESYVNMISLGLPAYVILDSMPDQRFAGVVAKVALLPDSQARWGNPNLKVYNTEVHITDDLPDVKPGVSAKAEIIITNITDTLSVPIQSVTTSRGRQVVYISNRGRDPEPRPVEVGMYNTKYIQITSGLKEGERILLAPPFDTQEKDLEGAVLTDAEKAKLKTNEMAKPRPIPVVPRSIEPGNGNGNGNGSSSPNPRAPAETRSPRAIDPSQTVAGSPSPGGNRPRGGAMPADIVKRFDTDGDGELNEAERAAMRQQFGGSRTNRGDRARGGGPGGGEGEARRSNRPEGAPSRNVANPGE
jgi:hypothetical protein